MRSRRITFVFAIIALAVGFLMQYEYPSAAPRGGAALLVSSTTATSSLGVSPVLRVIDGDTIVVLFEGVTTTVRLLGVDTPETVDPHKSMQCFGPEASAEVKQLLDGTSVQLEADPSQGHLDWYGRTLAYVYLPDGTLLDEFLIAQGYGREYTYHSAYKYQARFKAAQENAKREQRGLWSPTTCDGGTTRVASTTMQ